MYRGTFLEASSQRLPRQGNHTRLRRRALTLTSRAQLRRALGRSPVRLPPTGVRRRRSVWRQAAHSRRRKRRRYRRVGGRPIGWGAPSGEVCLCRKSLIGCAAPLAFVCPQSRGGQHGPPRANLAGWLAHSGPHTTRTLRCGFVRVCAFAQRLCPRARVSAWLGRPCLCFESMPRCLIKAIPGVVASANSIVPLLGIARRGTARLSKPGCRELCVVSMYLREAAVLSLCSCSSYQ